MNDILVLENDLGLKNYLSEVSKEEMFSSKINNFNFVKSSSAHSLIEDEIDQFYLVIVDFFSFSFYKEQFENKDIPIVLAFNKKVLKDKEFSQISELCCDDKFIIGLLDISLPIVLNRPLLRSFDYILKSHHETKIFKKIEQKISSFESFYEKEVKILKNLHKKLVPLRKEKIKGAFISSKFLAGLGSGGEFFDIKKDEGQVIIYLTSSNTYFLSSLCLSFFDELKKIKNIKKENLLDFFSLIEKNIINTKQENLKLQLGLFVLDLNTYKLWGFNFGKTFMKSTKNKSIMGNDYFLSKRFWEKSFFTLNLERSEKLFIFSPGFRKCSSKLLNEGQINKILEDRGHEESDDLLTEFFFQIKKESIERDFLEFDSSVLCLEVDNNAIMQI
jgi:hypothetical protein